MKDPENAQSKEKISGQARITLFFMLINKPLHILPQNVFYLVNTNSFDMRIKDKNHYLLISSLFSTEIN